MSEKPNWWPENPYPKEVFPMDVKQYEKIVPDDLTRTALAGALGRLFWNIAEKTIWDRVQEYFIEELEDFIENPKDYNVPNHSAKTIQILKGIIGKEVKDG